MYHCCCESSVYYFVHAVPDSNVARLQTVIYMNHHMAVEERGTYYYTGPVGVSHSY